MAQDRFQKVYDVLVSANLDAEISVGVGKVSGDGDALIAFQESSDMLVTDNTRQTRTIGVRLISLSVDAPRSKVTLRAAVNAIDAAPDIRVFDIGGISTELDENLPGPEGMFMATQVVDIR